MTAESKSALEALGRVFEGLARNGVFAIAYSGGLDSRFLSFAAQRLGYKPVLMHICGPHIPKKETEEAVEWAKMRGLELRVFELNPLKEEHVAAGEKMRCYWCKQRLFRYLLEQTDLTLVDGTNHSDTKAFRPGMKVLEELGVRSPLKEAGLTKPAIRRIGAELGFDNPEQPSRPCLLTRFPYGYRPSAELLRFFEEKEAEFSKMLDAMLQKEANFRIRLVEEKPVLHILSEDFEALDDVQCDALKEAANKSDIAVEPQEVLSGFFDKKKT